MNQAAQEKADGAMGDAFRPADRVVPGTKWSRRDTKFDLDGLDKATQIAMLRQWALAPTLRAEIAGVANSAQGFVREYGGSINHIRNMLNGHRLTDYATLALVVSIIEAGRLPDEQAVRAAMTAAHQRSQTQQSAKKPPSAMGYITPSGRPTGPSGQERPPRMRRAHPDAEEIRSQFLEVVREHPIARAYLATQSSNHTSLENDVEVFLTSPGEEDATGFIAGSTVSGTIWAAMDWRQASRGVDGPAIGGAFLLGKGRGNRCRAIEVFVEAGDSPETWDVSFRGADATSRVDGTLRWVPSQDDSTDSLPIDGRQQEADR